jgi:hypothetical protein
MHTKKKQNLICYVPKKKFYKYIVLISFIEKNMSN